MSLSAEEVRQGGFIPSSVGLVIGSRKSQSGGHRFARARRPEPAYAHSEGDGTHPKDELQSQRPQRELATA